MVDAGDVVTYTLATGLIVFLVVTYTLSLSSSTVTYTLATGLTVFLVCTPSTKTITITGCLPPNDRRDHWLYAALEAAAAYYADAYSAGFAVLSLYNFLLFAGFGRFTSLKYRTR